jgi:hypothetical protein
MRRLVWLVGALVLVSGGTSLASIGGHPTVRASTSARAHRAEPHPRKKAVRQPVQKRRAAPRRGQRSASSK